MIGRLSFTAETPRRRGNAEFSKCVLCVSSASLRLCGELALSLFLILPAHGTNCESSQCHVGIEPMHVSAAVKLACTDCHGGRADTTDKLAAHVQPRNRLQESPEYVRFVNPGDLRVANESCGAKNCHGDIVTRVRTSLMTHGGFLWGAALYNNDAFPLKRTTFGESYSRDGKPQKLTAAPPPTADQTKYRGCRVRKSLEEEELRTR